MIHSNSRRFYAQWMRTRLKPFERDDIHLPETVGADVEAYRLDIRRAADRGFRIVDMGPSARALLGRSPVGTPFAWLFHVGDRPEIDRMTQGGLDDGVGLLASATGMDDAGIAVPVEIILLPAGPGLPPALAGCLSAIDPRVGSDQNRPVGLLRLLSCRVPIVPGAEGGLPSARLRARAGYWTAERT